MTNKRFSYYLRRLRPLIKMQKQALIHQAAALWHTHRVGGKHAALPAFLAGGTDQPAAALTDLFGAFPSQEEGSENALTPELISFLDEEQAATRKTQGIFYTPYPLAKRLAQTLLALWLENRGYARENLPPPGSAPALVLEKQLAALRVCDPAAGSGGLLIPFWLELTDLRCKLNPKLAKKDVLLEGLQHNLYGADLRPQALENLRLRAALTLLDAGVTPPENLLPHLAAADALAGETCSVWYTLFPQVARQKGFDIFLANPPYVGQKNNRDIFNKLRQNPRWENKIVPKGDLLYLFFYLGMEITRPNGLAGFITTPYFAQAAASAPLRRYLQENTACRVLCDFETERLFPGAPGQHTLLSVFQLTRENVPCYRGEISPETKTAPETLYQGEHAQLQTRPAEKVLQSALTQMAAAPKRLGDVAVISNGLMSGCDKISAAHVLKFPRRSYQKGDGVFVLSLQEKNKLPLLPAEEKKLKPFFKNSDIFAYKAAQTPTHFLIDFFYPNDRETDFSNYPNLMRHLARFKPVLLARKQNNNGIDKQLAKGNYWFGSVRRKMDFEAGKIVVPHRARTNRFAYAPGAWYASSDVYFISCPAAPFSLWYLLALFNSAPYYAWLFYNGKRKGDLLELYAEPLARLPVAAASPRVRQKLEELARAQYACFSPERQKQVDETVAKLFRFSPAQTQAVFDFYRRKIEPN